MPSNDGEFWDHRFQAEGEIWGNSPSATAVLAVESMPAGARVLEVGFGYGRDLVFLARNQLHVTGIDLSREGHRHAEAWLAKEGLCVESLLLGRFEEAPFPDDSFDMIVCHRMAHLVVTAAGITQFVEKTRQVLRPGGVLCLGARNADSVNLTAMVKIEDKVYEYPNRPGHRIRFWDDAAFHETFGAAFTVRSLHRSIEPESVSQPIPCHLTVMAAEKKHAKAGAP